MADHPRSRGVYSQPDDKGTNAWGSSPLARGLLVGRFCCFPLCGIIPARAGFTLLRAAPGGSTPDHPRSRGVYQRGHVATELIWGSSPLARGLRKSLTSMRQVVRIIPARAGFTRRLRARGRCRPDHPRSRGVYHGAPPDQAGLSGSSPLARGLRHRVGGSAESGGIIPARAGFTSAWTRNPEVAGDHPRSRGVYTRMAVSRTEMWGSSPLARGLRVGDLSGPDRRRIIPARAGFTQDQCASAGPKPDHPRSRGVYGAGRINIPPHTGIIPARAGFTAASCVSCKRSPDHPRSRGVYAATGGNSAFQRGSSPLARGLLGLLVCCLRIPGIIPARAGFTCG